MIEPPAAKPAQAIALRSEVRQALAADRALGDFRSLQPKEH
jgi:hypothetical protein